MTDANAIMVWCVACSRIFAVAGRALRVLVDTQDDGLDVLMQIALARRQAPGVIERGHPRRVLAVGVVPF
jgi:hypothetical protein